MSLKEKKSYARTHFSDPEHNLKRLSLSNMLEEFSKYNLYRIVEDFYSIPENKKKPPALFFSEYPESKFFAQHYRVFLIEKNKEEIDKQEKDTIQYIRSEKINKPDLYKETEEVRNELNRQYLPCFTQTISTQTIKDTSHQQEIFELKNNVKKLEDEKKLYAEKIFITMRKLSKSNINLND